MPTPAFSALVMLCVGALLGLRFAFAALVGQLPQNPTESEQVADATMALPPKPMAGEELPDADAEGCIHGVLDEIRFSPSTIGTPIFRGIQP